MTADKIIQTMVSWIGTDKRKIIDIYNAHKPLAKGYKVKYTDAWCDATVSAAFIVNDAVDLIGATECGVERHIYEFKKIGIWIEDGSIVPKPGDIICYNWDDSTQPNDGYADHIGIVESYNAREICVIEGNYNEAVRRRVIPIGWGYIRGYARPKYDEAKKEEKTMCNTVIDVSVHQGQITWKKVQPYIAGAILRCGYGADQPDQDDKQWARNVSECERLGIPYAAYLYSYALDKAGARSEAAHALRLCKGHTPTVIYFDSEQNGTQFKARECAAEFVRLVREAGYKAGVYASASWYKSYLKGIDCDSLWIAAYGTNDGTAQKKYRPDLGEDLWQYTSMRTFTGISGRVDTNLMINDIFGAVDPAPEPAPEPEPASDLLTLVADTLAGKYGNGDDRVKYLGKNYNAVQDMINHIYKASVDTLAHEVIQGKYGNTPMREKVLRDRYAAVQKRVNQLLA